ncbi:hypothetical protein ACH5RR_029449 [Cinchona calisaya]|uniref:Uncharacterized protein n=1 Tax=Cinchona calisaya TaxID=153742 RepID=A0ABD2YWW5_9GENT
MHWGIYEDDRRAIEGQIRSRHWEGFNTQVDPGATQLVKEFHCNLCELEDGKVRIQGVLLYFSADVINAYFNIPPIPSNQYLEFLNNKDKDMNAIKDAICDRRVDWIKSTSSATELKFARQGVSLVAKL